MHEEVLPSCFASREGSACESSVIADGVELLATSLATQQSIKYYLPETYTNSVIALCATAVRNLVYIHANAPRTSAKHAQSPSAEL